MYNDILLELGLMTGSLIVIQSLIMTGSFAKLYPFQKPIVLYFSYLGYFTIRYPVQMIPTANNAIPIIPIIC